MVMQAGEGRTVVHRVSVRRCAAVHAGMVPRGRRPLRLLGVDGRRRAFARLRSHEALIRRQNTNGVLRRTCGTQQHKSPLNTELLRVTMKQYLDPISIYVFVPREL